MIDTQYKKSVKQLHDLRVVIPATPKRITYPHYVMDLCPFHNDSRPSMQISAWKFACHSCSAYGDLFNYTSLKLGWSFADTLSKHATLPTQAIEDPTEDYEGKPIPTFPSGVALRSHFNMTKPVLNYYASRGLSKSTILRYKLGFGPHPTEEMKSPEAVAWELQRFVIPLFEDGKLMGLKYRRNDLCPRCFSIKSDLLEDEIDSMAFIEYICLDCKNRWHVTDTSKSKSRLQKYLSELGQRSFLWGMKDIPDDYHGDVYVLVEGEFNRILLWQHGLHAVVCTNGAGSFKKQFATQLLKRDFKRYFIVGDSDSAGEKGIERVLQMIPNAKHIPLLPGYKDISDMVKDQEGVTSWLKYVSR